MECDVAVIGSGFGGSVTACRAAQAGLRVIVLERGRRMSDQAYADLADGRAPLLHGQDRPGLIEWHRFPGLRAITGNCVGGGSHLYTAVTLRAPPEIFDHRWPDELRGGTLDPYYDRVEAMIAPQSTSNPPARARAVCDIAGRLGGRGVVLPLSMNYAASQPEYPATARGRIATWLRGGRSSRKKTLDQTYLAAAEAAGTSIRTGHEAREIGDVNNGYHIRYWKNGDSSIPHSLTARKVILAAGTLGTLRLLLFCRDAKSLRQLSPAVGNNFFTNGDFGALLLWPKCALIPDDGPPVTAWLDWWKEDRLYLMETNHFVGGRIWSFGVMGFDDSSGQIALDSASRLRHTHNPCRAEPFHAARLKRLRELASACGARLLHLPSRGALQTPYTVHPLGGAAMADSPQRGVVDSDGQVFGYPGLYVADGSILPTPIGCAPSMTIAALAERISEHLIAHA